MSYTSKLSSAIRKNLPELSSFLSGSEGQLEVEIGGLTSEDLSSIITMDNLYDDHGKRIRLILDSFEPTIKKIFKAEDLARAIRFNTSFKRNGEGLKALLEFASEHNLLELNLGNLLSSAIHIDTALRSETNSSTQTILDFLAQKAREIISEEHQFAAKNNPAVSRWLTDILEKNEAVSYDQVPSCSLFQASEAHNRKEGEPEPESEAHNRKEGDPEPGSPSSFTL